MALMASVLRIASSVVRIVLEPLFMFGLIGLPSLGIVGVPVASTFSLIICIFLAIVMLLKNNMTVLFSFQHIKLSFRFTKNILKYSVPSILLKLFTPVCSFLIMIMLSKISPEFVVIYGLFIRIQNLVLMPISGLCQAYVPISSYLNGKKDFHTLRKSLKFVLQIVAVFSTALTILIFVFRARCMEMFKSSDSILQSASDAIAYLCWGIITVCIVVVLSNFLQSILQPMSSLIITICEYVLFLIPALSLLLRIYGHPTFWISFPASSAGALLVALFFVGKFMKSLPKDDKKPPL